MREFEKLEIWYSIKRVVIYWSRKAQDGRNENGENNKKFIDC